MDWMKFQVIFYLKSWQSDLFESIDKPIWMIRSQIWCSSQVQLTVSIYYDLVMTG